MAPKFLVERIATATLPVTAISMELTAHAFRDRAGIEHLSLLKGEPGVMTGKRPPLVRLHSECLTGDVFGSRRCDCGAQLNAALHRIAATDCGALIYLRGHEGRGIGLAKNIRAYALQDRGLDTVEANHRLGFATDLRDWSVAAAILRDLQIGTLELLTNNPRKVIALEEHGLTVAARIPLDMPWTAHNEAYLRTKREKMGHVLDAGHGSIGTTAGCSRTDADQGCAPLLCLLGSG